MPFLLIESKMTAEMSDWFEEELHNVVSTFRRGDA